MLRFRYLPAGALLAAALLLVSPAFVSPLWAARPAQILLPKTTKGYISIPNVDRLRENWNRTELGQLTRDPRMQPFVQDLKEQFNSKLSESRTRLGLTWEDLEGVPGGEVAAALIQPQRGKSALVMLVDVTGHLEQMNKMLDKVAASLARQGAKRSQETIDGLEVTIFDFAKADGETHARQAFYVVKDNMLVVSDDLEQTKDVLGRFAADATGRLENVTAFVEVMKRCAKDTGPVSPDLKWFIEPFGFAEIMRPPIVKRTTRTKAKAKDGKAANPNDMVEILKSEGFSAIQGLGGFVSFSTERHELLHRTAIHAPADGKSRPGEKFTGAARMLDFPNAPALKSQPWVPREIATYVSFNWKTSQAFEMSKSLFDRAFGSSDDETSAFEDIVEGWKKQKFGPKIDVRREVLPFLGTRVTVVTDYELPITTTSERRLYAIEISDPAAIAKAVDKYMLPHKEARKLLINGIAVWEIVEKKEDVKPAVVDVPDLDIKPVRGEDDDQKSDKEKKSLPNSAICVAHGHLLVASHLDILKKVLAEPKLTKRLGDTVDYQIVHDEMDRLGAGSTSFRFFSRTDEEYRPTYELIKSGRMPVAETMFARLLNRLLDDRKSEEPRKQKIDGGKMPDYDMVRRYLGPAGGYIATEDAGWYIVGFTLSKQPRVAAAARAAAEEKK